MQCVPVKNVQFFYAQRKAIILRPGQLPRLGGEGQQGRHQPGEREDHFPLRLRAQVKHILYFH